MIILSGATDKLSGNLLTVVTEFRRAQTSKFPVHAVVRADGQMVSFFDSRMPIQNTNSYTDGIATVCYKRMDNGTTAMRVYSRLIKNEKFAGYNREYHTKTSTDCRKVVKTLLEFAKPYTPRELFQSDYSTVSSGHEEWKSEPRQQFNEIANNIRPQDIVAEVQHQIECGVKFSTEKFQRIAAEGLELFAEAKRRAAKPEKFAHVLQNPDDTYTVTTLTTDKDPVSTTYQSIEECPKHIHERVALLRMMDNNKFVPEVGVRSTTNMYYVYW